MGEIAGRPKKERSEYSHQYQEDPKHLHYTQYSQHFVLRLAQPLAVWDFRKFRLFVHRLSSSWQLQIDEFSSCLGCKFVITVNQVMQYFFVPHNKVSCQIVKTNEKTDARCNEVKDSECQIFLTITVKISIFHSQWNTTMQNHWVRNDTMTIQIIWNIHTCNHTRQGS